MEERLRILLTEDDENLGMLLREYLQAKGFNADLFSDGEAGYKAFLKGKYDICVLDVMMPKKDGFTLAQEIRTFNAEVPIIFLTAKSLKEDILEGFKIGADDYITKPFGLQELLARIEAHLRRDERNMRPPEVVTSQGLIINLSDRKVFWNEQELSFSKREFDIIEFLSSNPNQVFDKERIYETVWGYDAEGDSNVIKEHIRKIRAKLMQASGSEYIETVWGMGYRWKK